MSLRNRLAEALKAFQHPYEPTVATDWQADLRLQVQRDLKALAELSAEMLQDQRYGRLRDLYQRILEQNLRLMIWYDAPSSAAGNLNEVYMDAMRRLQHQLRILTQIVSMPKEFVAKAEDADKSQRPPDPMKAYVGDGGERADG